MRLRETEVLKALKWLKSATNDFTNPRLILIGGYALRAYVKYSRYTRDCDFALRRIDGWGIDKLKLMLPKGFSVEVFEKRKSYGFMRCIKLVTVSGTRVKVSLDFMECEIRGRSARDVIVVDDKMVDNSKSFPLSIANSLVKLPVVSYVDLLIMKVVSARPSDVRDVASMLLENGVPKKLKERLMQVLPFPEVFREKLESKILPEMRSKTFLHSWRGAFGTSTYSEEDRMKVLKIVMEMLKLI